MSKSVLVTGGCGFIGSNLIKRMLETGDHQIVVVDKLTYASNQLALDTVLKDPRVRMVAADIADRPTMATLFDEVRPAAVLNLAAETHVDRSIESAWAFVATNINGTVVLLEESLRMLKAASDEERKAFRFLHVSTDEVFGSLGAEGLFSESTAYAPNSPYAASKASADHMVRAFAATHGLPALITNCSNNYGPFQHPEKLIPLMILNALDARRLPIYGDGGNVRDWLHVDDHCAALLAVLEHGRVGESYNVGASNEQSNVQIVDRLCEVIEALVPARTNEAMRAAGVDSYLDLRMFVADRPGHDRRYAVDATKLRSELGWRPRHTFVEGLRDTVQWYVANRRRLDSSHVGYDRQRLGLGAVTA